MFIAREIGRPLGRLPERVAVSVITLGELELSMLAAADETVLARRADTLALAREFDPIPVSEAVMTAWARMVLDCRRAGVERTVRLTDALIAATAVAHRSAGRDAGRGLRSDRERAPLAPRGQGLITMPTGLR